MLYVPNILASSMRSKKAFTIGVISADSSNPYFSEVIKGAEEKAQEYGYHIILSNTDENKEKELSLIRHYQERQIDGLLIMPSLAISEEHVLFYKNLDIPYIFVGRTIEGLEDHSIVPDDEKAEFEIFDFLLDKGHRNILYLNGPKNVSNSFSRYEGMLQAYRNRNVGLQEDLVFWTSGHIEEGYALINHALKRNLDFSAVVCFNDLLAIGVLKSLHENDLKVPEQVEVFGFDNLYISQFLTPALSTVDVSKYRMGMLAMERLHEHIVSQCVYEEVVMPTRLVFRETSYKTL